MTYYMIYSTLFIALGATYLYGLYNLYIGRKTTKYRAINLTILFAILTAYFVVIVMTDLRGVGVIITMIAVLVIIVLGIVGGFMYDKKSSIPKIREYTKRTKSYKITLISVYVLSALSIIYNLSFGYITHSIERLHEIEVVYDIDYDNEKCDSHLQFNEDDEAELMLYCYRTFNNEEIESITIKVDGDILHFADFSKKNVSDNNVGEGYILYSFEYDFVKATKKAQNSETFKLVEVELVLETDTITFSSSLIDIRYEHNPVVVPIWIKE